MCKPCWWGVSKILLKYVHWLPSSDDFPLVDRANSAAHDYSEYIFPRNNLFLEKFGSDTFDLKNWSDYTRLVYLLLFISSILYFSVEIFSGMSIMKSIFKVLFCYLLSCLATIYVQTIYILFQLLTLSSLERDLTLCSSKEGGFVKFLNIPSCCIVGLALW